MASKKKWDDLDITNDEAKRLCEAFKNDEFRKMFIEYAEEIQDPENKKRYEEELATLEAERGMDVKFIHPEPGYVMKTIVDGTSKAFINICMNEHIGKPECKKAMNPQTGKMAPSWSIPHSLAPPRDDIDNSGEKCRVFDVVFHPDAYRMGESNVQFRKLINDSAIETIEVQHGVKIDKTNLKFPKMKFKGTPSATILRSRKDGSDKTTETKENGDIITDKLQYPYDNKTSAEKAKENEAKSKQKASKKTAQELEFEVPKHTIVHRQNIDFQDFRNAPDAGQSTRPKELVIHIELPLLKSASSANLDIFEKRLLLESTSPAKYRLDLSLPYPVDENNGSAKFDKSKRRLVITLPVLPPDLNELSTGEGLSKGNDSVINGNNEQGQGDNDVAGLDDDVPGLEDDVPGLEDDVPGLEDDVPTIGGDTLSNVSNTNGRPLIEVVSSKDNAETTTPLTNGHATEEENPAERNKDIWEDDDFDPELLKPKLSYKLPTYTANQDAETTTFILSVKNAQRESISKTFGENSVQLRFLSMGSGGFPMHYSFTVKFDDDYRVDVTACDVSMSCDNIVMILGKTSEAAGIWDKFLVGIDSDHLEEALFVTEKTLSSALDQLDANTMPLNNNDKMPDLEVTDMSDDQLTIQLSNTHFPEKPQRTKKYSESSDDIEVVHSGDVPNLHGILKGRNRTVSESSDEVFAAGGVRGAYRREDSVSSVLSTGSASEGPVSESEDPNTPHRKKSVSFSEYVDSTTYKSNASVSTLHASLKKKSKRYRKKEAKIERRRRRSSGSEHEHSSEEHSSQPETSEGGEAGEEEDDDVVIDHQGAPGELPEEPRSDLHDEEEESLGVVATKQPNKKSKKSKKKNKRQKSAKEGFSEPNAASHTPPETKAGDSVTSEEGESAVECVTSEDKQRTNVNGEVVNGKGESVQQENGQDIDSDDTEQGPSAPVAKAGPTPDESQSDPGRTSGKRDPDAPETMLSWNTEKSSGESSDVTKCAFNFNNSMMYDLDDD